MEDRFSQNDIGKRVILELDVEKDSLARRLGANRVEVTGELLAFNKEFVQIKVESGSPYFTSKETRVIAYGIIKNYEFL